MQEEEIKKHAALYTDADMLTATQVAEVISENSGSSFYPGNASHLIERGRIEGAERFGNVWKYPYKSVKNLVVRRDSRIARDRVVIASPAYNGLLSASEAAAIVSRNSGHVVNSQVLARLASMGKIAGVQKFGTRYQYPLESIQGLIISRELNGGRKKHEHPSEGALRVRKHRANKRQ